MKIVIIGPGKMEIPPRNWGAIEILIWDYYQELEKLGHQVILINTTNLNEIIELSNQSNPDFVHLHYDEYYEVLDKINCKNKAVTSHYGYLEGYIEYKNLFKSRLFCVLAKNRWLRKIFIHPPKLKSLCAYLVNFEKFIQGSQRIFALSDKIIDIYQDWGLKTEIFLTPNGARDDQFRFTLNPKYPERSIYLAKIDFRKRQYCYQNIANLYFVGGVDDQRFNVNSANYLGLWTKEYLYANLSDYANLVLLSDGEAHALVCCEALVCGLGLVVSEYASANLDLSLPFIDVIPTAKLNDLSYVTQIIEKNKILALTMRAQIRNYGCEHFSWHKLVKSYSLLLTNLVK